MIHRVTLIPGDGVGPEVTEATRTVLEATGVKFQWDIMQAGEEAVASCGTPLPHEVLSSIKKNRVALKGPITTPVGTGFRSVNVALRKELGLYACLRPCKSFPGAPVVYPDVDLVIVRENMEDLYAGIEFEKGTPALVEIASAVERLTGQRISPDSGLSLKPISEAGSRRIVQFAFEYARRNHRTRVTAVHKANIMKFSDGLFLRVAREVAADYPDIEFEDRIVDNMAMQLVRRPTQFDVLVTPNLYGDILSDLGAGLIGGLGLAPGANLSDEYAIFEATHGSAPKYKGLNKVNPMAMMLSGVMMLAHLGENEAATRLEEAIARVIGKGETLTYDLIPPGRGHKAATTSEVAEAVVKELSKP